MGEYIFLIIFIILFAVSMLVIITLVNSAKINRQVEELLNSAVDCDSDIIDVEFCEVEEEPEFVLYNKDGAVEKMSRVSLVLDDDKYVRIIKK